MRIYATLPAKRTEAGRIWAVDADARVILQPARALGKADNLHALACDNVLRDPLRPGGDHPLGIWRIMTVVPIDLRTHQADTYGPFFLRLAPVSGPCLEAVERGHRGGFGIHGGRLLPDGQLRPTFGCLRVDDMTITQLAMLVRPDLGRGLDVIVECAEQKTP